MGCANVTAGIPQVEDEHASLFRGQWKSPGGTTRRDGAEAPVDTSIRRRPYDDAELTGVQVQV
ncbi:hypothetical protein FRZ03_13740 [Streptomyces misionensis]|uniref:Uncharacterized protein n=1 Tax=Streptomyces misionensis TaxID=67331 RepID=A0A5C6JUA1_9ACTN|nr:hypothetical protein FRZ03_13740 [Streptomyces misionensis]